MLEGFPKCCSRYGRMASRAGCAERRGRVVVEINQADLQFAVAIELPVELGDDLDLRRLVIDERIRRNTLSEKDVAADGAARADDGFPPSMVEFG